MGARQDYLPVWITRTYLGEWIVLSLDFSCLVGEESLVEHGEGILVRWAFTSNEFSHREQTSF